MWTVTARFNVCGYQCREVDLTPAIGIAFILVVVGSLLVNTVTS